MRSNSGNGGLIKFRKVFSILSSKMGNSGMLVLLIPLEPGKLWPWFSSVMVSWAPPPDDEQLFEETDKVSAYKNKIKIAVNFAVLG